MKKTLIKISSFFKAIGLTYINYYKRIKNLVYFSLKPYLIPILNQDVEDENNAKIECENSNLDTENLDTK